MKTCPPSVELLEDRCVPVTWGNPWPDAFHLTVSFSADGTMVGDHASDLQATLSTQAARETWQQEVLRAFQTWAVNANINLGLVADGGQDLGSAGRPQGDSRYGDLRIAGYSQPDADELAIASPFESVAGTWSGDVRVNTSAGFGINGQGDYDLFSALLHEAGHTFGLAHSTDPNSPMYEDYLGIRSGLSTNNVAMLQALYGVRSADKFEGSTGNETFGSATRLSLLTNPDGSLGVAAEGDVRSLSDKDVFRFQAPLTLGPLSIQLKTAGLSLLTAKMTVYDSANRVVGFAAASNPLSNDLSIRINSPSLLGTYYVKVESGTNDVFGVGSYRLEVKSLPVVQTLTGAVGNVVNAAKTLLSDDLHTNDSFLTASLVPPLTAQVNSRFDYAFRGSVRDSWDVDYYRVTAPQAPAGTESVMSVMLWGLDNDGLRPRASVYDAKYNLVQADTLVNADGIFTIQVRNAVAGASYFVKVEAADAKGPNNVGNYFLGVDFGTKAVQLDTITTGTLNASQPASQGVLTIAQYQTAHLVLGATGAPATVHLTVTDAQGRVVAILDAVSGRDPVSLTGGLAAGQYILRFSATSSDGSPLAKVNFTLKGTRLSDPIGPKPEDSTSTPTGSSSSSNSTGSGAYTPPPTGTQSSSTGTQPPPTSTSTQPPPSSQPPPTPEEQYYAYHSAGWYYYNGQWYYYDGNNVSSSDPYGNSYPTN